MKKIAKKFGLSLAALACVTCAGVGVSLSLSETATTADAAIAESDFWISSTGIRLVNDANGSGIRFHTNVTTDVYDTIVESGALIIPEVRCDGELTLDDLNNADTRTRPVQVVTKDENGKDLWYTYEYTNADGTVENVMRSTVYLYNLPESMYGARMIAVSYVTTLEGTTYTEIPTATSISDVASKVSDSEEYGAQVAPYIVDEVTVTYNMPDGSKQPETVAYGSKLSGPTYNNAYVITGLTDNYGNSISLDSYEATLPVTIDVELAKYNVGITQLINDAYDATAEERAFVNGKTATAVTDDVPDGYSSVLKLDWYSGSTAMWDIAGGRDLYRTCFSGADISAYDRVTFALKLVTDGDAYVSTSNKKTNLGANAWLYFELVQTSEGVWNVTVKNEAGETVYTKTGETGDSGAGFVSTTSIGALVFARGGYNGAATGDTTKWEYADMLALYCPSSAEMTASVYMTEVRGYNLFDFDPEIPDNATRLWNHAWNSYYFDGGEGAEGAYAEEVEAPVKFNYVSEWSWTGGDFNKTGHLSLTDVSAYSDLYFAMKVVNGQIYVQGGPNGGYSGGDWLYVHLHQEDDKTWTKTLRSPDGYEATQTGLTGYQYKTWDSDDEDTAHDQYEIMREYPTIVGLLNYTYSFTGTGSTGSYPKTDSGVTATAYFTDVLAIKKDGSAITAPTKPDYAIDPTTFDPEISADAEVIRSYTWRDSKYALSSSTTEPAPVGYGNVIEFNWAKNTTMVDEKINNVATGNKIPYMSMNTDMALDCLDEVDLSNYNEFWFAMKQKGGAGFYVRGASKYTGGGWLYYHGTRAEDGTWTLEFTSEDGGYTATQTGIKKEILKGMLSYHGKTDAEPWDSGAYPTRNATYWIHKTTGERVTVNPNDTTNYNGYSNEESIIYLTEIFGVSESTKDRVIFSAVDGGVPTTDVIGIPAGFTATYKYTNFTMDKFAALDLSDTIYQEITFGMLADNDFTFKTGYKYTVSGETEERPTTSISSKTTSSAQMYLVTLTKNDDGSWHVTMKCNRWSSAPASGGSAYNTTDLFETDVTGNSINEVMNTFLNAASGMTLYCTEVRGTHTCAYNNTKSLGNGYLQDYCICGKTWGDPVAFAHEIADEAVEVRYAPWRDDKHALSASTTEEIPVGYTKIIEFNWENNSASYQSAQTDFSPYIFDGGNNADTALNINLYSDLYYAVKLTGSTKGYYITGTGKFVLTDDWVYLHYTRDTSANTWSLSLSSPDANATNVGKNVKTGVSAANLSELAAATFYATRTTADEEAMLYFTEVKGILACTHVDCGVKYESNNDGTHNELCANCNTVIEKGIVCTGGTATCTQQAACEICGGAHGEAGHVVVFEDGSYVGTCENCGETALNTGIPDYATQVWAHIWNSYYFTGGGQAEGAYADGVEAPDGFSKVSYYSWTSTSSNDFPITGHLNNTTTISNYSDLWFAMKVVNGMDIYVQGADLYTGGNWLYVHMTQASDGTWSKDFYAIDGYTAIGKQTALTDTNLAALMQWKSGVNRGSYPRLDKTAGQTATAYFTDVVGVLKCSGTTHTEDVFVSNGDGTHSVSCRCGEVISASVTCSGSEATCTEAATCSACGADYSPALGHSGSWTDANEYYCNRCDTTFGQVVTSLNNQTSALATNASAATFKANEARALTLDLSAATALPISAATVELDGTTYTATIADGNVLTINVLPNAVFGNCEATVTATIEGESFTITAPVLVVTNMVTTAQGMLDMRTVLRGADLTTADEFSAIGGKGGETTMNGDGYYMLGANIEMTQNKAYVFGTSYVPFVGTFDGNGYILNNYRQNNWFSSNRQDNYLNPTQVANGTSIDSGIYGTYLEGSLFGVLNGTVKNVAFTNVQQAIFTNIVHSGSGRLVDVYIDISDLQSNANIYVPILFARAEASSTYGALTNVVIDVQDATMSTTASSHYPSLGKYFSAENVAVYGFDTSWIKSDGTRGNVYTGTDNVNGDGSAAGIYVEYVDGTTNGATFWQSVLSDDIWKIVDGVPYLKNVTVSGTVTDPSDSTVEGSAEYNFAWSDTVAGSYDAIQFINNVTTSATGTTLGVTATNLTDLSTKQVIVGSYETYAKYISNGPTEYDGTNYGVYVNGNTIFVLAESEDAFVFAAQEFCRQMYGWKQLTYLQCDADAIVLDSSLNTLDSSRITNYTTKVTFEKREPANGLSGTYDRTDLGFNGQSPFSYYGEMHNSLDYFDVHSDATKYTDKAATWDSTTYPNAKIANAYNTGSASSATQLCYLGKGDKNTFDAMVAHVVTIITAKKASNPKAQAFNLMLEDNTDYCTCSACGQFSNPSVTQTIFLNAVANKLAANGIDVDVEFFSYNAYSPAPILSSTELTSLASLASTLGITYETTTVDYSDLSYASKLSSTSATVLKCADGLRLWWTSHEANHSFELEHEANAHMYMALKAWIASIGKGKTDVFMYQQTYRDYFTPLNTWEYQILWYQSLNKLGVNTHMFNLGDVYNAPDKQTGFAAFKTYIDSRAMTDMNVTFEELKDEFFAEDGYYGKGGPTMRTFFEELVEVYESHKQGGTAQFVSTTDFGNSTDASNGQKNTLWNSDAGYVAGWIIQKNYYDRDKYPNYYAHHRQAFFNGSYGRDLTAIVFGGRGSSGDLTPATNVYVHSNYASQQATLEAWYTYCMEALGKVDANSKYATRIKIEALFPEYQYLVYQSTYTTTASETPTVTSTAPTDTNNVFTNDTVDTSKTWYQNLYEACVALGVVRPAEFYAFLDTVEPSCVAEKKVVGTIYSYYYMYKNMWQNWSIKAA